MTEDTQRNGGSASDHAGYKIRLWSIYNNCKRILIHKTFIGRKDLLDRDYLISILMA